MTGIFTVQMLELLAGAIFLLIAVSGGGITAKEVTVPKIPIWGRCAAAVVGTAFIGAGVLIPAVTSSPTQPCRNPRNLPNLTDVVRSEADARNALLAAGLFNVVSEPVFVPSAPRGIVTGQSPAPGMVLCPREQVTLKITQ